MRVRTTWSSEAPALERASPAISKIRRVCPAASSLSAPTGPVPARCTEFPTRTARENPMMGSKGEPPLMFWRITVNSEQQTVDSGPQLITVHCPLTTALQPLLYQEADQVNNAAGVAPFVVVPAQHLDALTHNLGQRKVDDGRERVALVVGADQQVRVNAQNALQFAICGGCEGCVQAFDGGRLLADEGQVDDGNVRCGDADRKTVQLAGSLGNDQLQGLGGAGRARNHAQCSGTCAAQVLVRKIEDDLVVGVAVDGSHDAADQSDGLKNNLDHRRQAIGGAAGVGDDVVLGRVVLVLVDAKNHGDVFVA